MRNDFDTYLPNDILAKMDRATMFNSLEARAPLLDKRIIEFAFSIPLSKKIQNGRFKCIMRESLNDYIPYDRLGSKRKMGFSMPLASWLKGDLKEWVYDSLSENIVKRNGYIPWDFVKNVLEAHYSGKSNYGQEIWNILILHNWLERRYSNEIAHG